MTVEEDSGQVYGGVDTHEDSIHGEPIAIGIEGTSSYGVAITAAAVAEGLVVVVVVVILPERAERRRLGKSDPIDAYQAARAALGNHRIAPAKNNAAIEGVRALPNARRSAMKARTAAMRQIYAQLITAPSVIREKYRDLSSEKRRSTGSRWCGCRATLAPVAVPGVNDLRALRQAKNITLTAAANQLGVWPTTISELERGIRRNDELAQTYRRWLTAA